MALWASRAYVFDAFGSGTSSHVVQGFEQNQVKSFMFCAASAFEPSGTSFWYRLCALGSKMGPMGATCGLVGVGGKKKFALLFTMSF